jgi:hypothetical protein
MPFRLTRSSGALVVLLIGAGACRPSPPKTVPQPAAAGAFPFKSATFSSVLRWETGPSISSRFWISPQGLLKEITDQGKVSFVLHKAGAAYKWDAGSHEGKKGILSGGPRMTGEPDTLDVLRLLPEVFKPGNFEFSGYEKLEGVPTPKYSFRFRDPRLRVEWKGILWLLPDRAFPVRYVNLGFGGRYEIVNSRMVFDPTLPPELFELPSDVQFKNVDLRRK